MPEKIRRPARKILLAAGTLAIALSAGCQKDPCDVVLFTNVHQLYAAPPLARFQRESGLEVCASYPGFGSKTTGVLNQLLESQDAPAADVYWGEDVVRPFALVKRGLVERYQPPAAEGIPERFRDPGGLWTGVGAQVRVLLVNTKLVPEGKRPASIRDLGDRRFKDRAAIPNPRHGTTLVHLAALSSAMGEQALQDLLGSFDRNGVKILGTSWEVKEMVAKGEVAVGLTNSDHAYEAVKAGAPVAVVIPDQEPGGLGALVLPTGVFLIQGGPHSANGRRLVDFLVGPDVDRDLAADNVYFALRPDAPDPVGAPKLDTIRATPLDPIHAEEALERLKLWLDKWFP